MNKAMKQKVTACWLGKTIAGGLGAPYEGVPYRMALKADELVLDDGPNDDLELQILWLIYLEKHGIDLSSVNLTDAWLNIIKYGMDEYGVAIRNLRRGLKPPMTGYVDNWFHDGMGAAIRTEIWACVFNGNPSAAAEFARRDSVVDHNGDGVWASMFWAAAAASAFESDSLVQSLETGLGCIDSDCRTAQVVRQVMKDYLGQMEHEDALNRVMKNFGSNNFTDCVMNAGTIVAALLYGEGDFDKTILYAINAAQDTDCTAATAGAFLGIQFGVECIPQKWAKKLSTEIAVSSFLNLDEMAKTLDELTDRVEVMADRFSDTAIEANYEPITEAEYPFESSTWLILPHVSPEQRACAEQQLASGGPLDDELRSNIHTFKGIELSLDDCLEQGRALNLYTRITVEEDFEGQLMVVGDDGITAWLDGTRVMNYHGRFKALPAFHRAEGGASVRVVLKKGESYLLRVAFNYAHKPLSLHVALGDENNQYVNHARYNIEG